MRAEKDPHDGPAPEAIEPFSALIRRLDPRYRPVWEGTSAEAQAALAAYFLPRRSAKPLVCPTRPRLIKWYCPFADQARFPSGHRYCLNVYTGCAHGCCYCYAAGYAPPDAATKRNFRRLLDRDLDDLERFGVPPAPLHISNSTDPLQPLERRAGHTRYALERILAHRRRFTTVTLLTRNPKSLLEGGYVDLLAALVAVPGDHPARERMAAANQPGLRLHVSLAFWREAARRALEPNAPPLADRIEALESLAEAGIPLVLRIDPLFPRSPLPSRDAQRLADFGLPELQTLDDLEQLVLLARRLGAMHVVYSAAKLVRPRRGAPAPAVAALKMVYEAICSPGKPVWRGGSWRLIEPVARQVTEPFLQLCRRHGVEAKHCMADLLSTP